MDLSEERVVHDPAPRTVSEAPGPPASVELEIGELVLHGFAPGDRHRIGESFERELTRLLTDEGVPASLGETVAEPRLDGGTFELQPGMAADEVGARLARQVYRGLGG
jgi:hypothetical protein